MSSEHTFGLIVEELAMEKSNPRCGLLKLKARIFRHKVLQEDACSTTQKRQKLRCTTLETCKPVLGYDDQSVPPLEGFNFS
jgi:hypothetical protein